MKDKENPNIEYPQISVLLILIFIVFIFLAFMALGFSGLTLYTHIYNTVHEGKDSVKEIVLFSLLSAFLIYALIVNFIVMFKAYFLKLDDHIILYTLLTYLSLNIPCAIIIHKSIRRKKDDD